MGTLSARLERFDVTAPITFVLAGVLLTHGPLAPLGFAPSHETVKVLAEITLVLGVTVLLSVIVHGATADPLARVYGPRIALAAGFDDQGTPYSSSTTPGMPSGASQMVCARGTPRLHPWWMRLASATMRRQPPAGTARLSGLSSAWCSGDGPRSSGCDAANTHERRVPAVMLSAPDAAWVIHSG